MRKASFYDADNDIYHLSRHGNGNENTTTANRTPGINNKATVLSKLDRELAQLTTQLQQAQARVRFHEQTQQRAIEVLQSKHAEHVERVKLHLGKHQRQLKQKLSKANKDRAKAWEAKQQLQVEVSALQTAMTDITANKGQTMGEIDNLSGRVRLLNEQLTESSNVLEVERTHSVRVERNLHEVGTQLELIAQENERLQQLRLVEDTSREHIIAQHGEEMRALAETLARRTVQLNQSEEKLNEARQQREAALSTLETYRSDHHLNQNETENLIMALRTERNGLKDDIAELKRTSTIDNGKVTVLEVQLQDKKEEIVELKTRLDTFNDQLGKVSMTEQDRTTRLALVSHELELLKVSSSEQTRRHEAQLLEMQATRQREQMKLGDEIKRNDQLTKNINAVEEERRLKEEQNVALAREIAALEEKNAVLTSQQGEPRPSSNSFSDESVQAAEVARLQKQVETKDKTILAKGEEIAGLVQKLSELEAEVARRTLRAAGKLWSRMLVGRGGVVGIVFWTVFLGTVLYVGIVLLWELYFGNCMNCVFGNCMDCILGRTMVWLLTDCWHLINYRFHLQAWRRIKSRRKRRNTKNNPCCTNAKWKNN